MGFERCLVGGKFQLTVSPVFPFCFHLRQLAHMAAMQCCIEIAKPQIRIDPVLAAAVDDNIFAHDTDIPDHAMGLSRRSCHEFGKIGCPALNHLTAIAPRSTITDPLCFIEMDGKSFSARFSAVEIPVKPPPTTAISTC